MTDFARPLADLHAGFTAPAVLITTAAREITRSPISARKRIVHGEANEVYAIAFDNCRTSASHDHAARHLRRREA